MTDLNDLRLKIFTALGEASMCWNPKPEGVFDPEAAKEIGDKFMAEMEPLFRELEELRQYKVAFWGLNDEIRGILKEWKHD